MQFSAFSQKILLLASCLQICLSDVTYSYSSGGTDWTGTCSSGTLQSPIDISDVQGSCDNTMNLTFSWNNASLSTKILKDNGDLRSTVPTGADNYWSRLYASDLTGVISGYKSSVIKIHCPAENYLDGSQSDVELQIVHDLTIEGGASTSQAIVSIMFNVDTTATSTFFSTYDTTAAGTTSAAASISLNMSTAMSTFFDSTKQYYLYQGSQTVPPCTENVNWYVYSLPLSITTDQLSTIQSYFSKELKFAGGKGNNRDIQSTNSRTIKKGNIECEEQFIHFFSFFVIYTFLNFFVCKML